MGIWTDQLLPRFIDKALGNEGVDEWRIRCLDGIAGVVVEPGFGSGLNMPHYPPEVTKVYAVDPAVVGRKLAADRVAAASCEVEYVGLDGQHLPLDDASCDAGVLTFTLCTIPDHMQALAELRRVIKPGGTLHFLEHGLAPDANVVKWQNRLTPIQRRFADGCHFNKPILELIEAGGFDIEWSDSAYAGGPKPPSWFSVGRARRPD